MTTCIFCSGPNLPVHSGLVSSKLKLSRFSLLMISRSVSGQKMPVFRNTASDCPNETKICTHTHAPRPLRYALYTACFLQGGVSIYLYAHTPPCTIRHTYTACILQENHPPVWERPACWSALRSSQQPPTLITISPYKIFGDYCMRVDLPAKSLPRRSLHRPTGCLLVPPLRHWLFTPGSPL
jgi:hypothetical protein